MATVALPSPLGTVFVVADGAGLRWVGFDPPPARHASGDEDAAARTLAARAAAELDEYFAGQRRTFDLPLAPQGDAFRLAVWRALAGIPFGATASYGDIARRLGRPGAARAVGAANAANPIGIIVPCHRVIGADGSLTGYAGGLQRKRWLLGHEGALATGDLFGG